MKVLFVNRMLSMIRGGGETFDLEIGRHLQELGCSVSYLSGIPMFSGPRLRNPFSLFREPPRSVHLRSPYTGGLPWARVPGGWRLRELDFRLFEARAARWVLRHQADFDVIQVCELPELVKQLKRGGIDIPVCMRMPGPHLFTTAYGRGSLEVADAVIASGTSIAFFRERLSRDVVNVPNGVDTSLFFPAAPAAPSESLPHQPSTFLYVAQFQRCKNHGMLLEAMRRVKASGSKARLILAGDGPEKSRAMEWAQKEGLVDVVDFRGNVNTADMPALYRAADVKIIASDYESFSFVALEAMASGLPVITTRTDWVPRLIGDPGAEGGVAPSVQVGGWVVPIGDAEAMACAIKDAMISRERCLSMGARNRKHVLEQYTWTKSAEKLRDLYRGLMEGG